MILYAFMDFYYKTNIVMLTWKHKSALTPVSPKITSKNTLGLSPIIVT